MIIYYLNIIVLIFYILLLVIDIFNLLTLMSITSVILYLINTLGSNNVEYQNLLLSSLIKPVILLLFCLSILSFIYNKSNSKVFLKLLFNTFNNKLSFTLVFLLFVFFLSGFINNALVVSSLIPILNDVCEKKGWNNRILLMGLSFISMLGGTITIIGSSTNLIALSLLEPTLTISMFEFTKYSVPVGIIGIIYITIISYLNKIKFNNNNKRCLLNNEKLDIQLYFFKIQICSSLIGNNVKKSKLQEFCGLQLVGIERDNDFNCRPVRSFVNLQENDILIYIGSNFNKNSSCFKTKLNIYSMLEIHRPDYQSNIASGIIPRYFSKIINQTIIDINFKTTFNMVLLGIIRNKKLLKLNIKNEKILSGDTIIVYGINGYSNMISNLNRICIKPYSISKISNKCTSNNNYDNILLFISLILIIINGVYKFMDLTLFCIIICLLFLLIGNIDIIDIYNSFYTYRNVIIGTSLSLFITKSLEISNVLFNISKVLSKIIILDRWFQYFLVHFITSCLSIILSNASVIAIMIPIIKIIYIDSIYIKPIVLCCIHGASCCFGSPTGYHTNLMINDIGGFKCLDFLFIGIPLHILISVMFSSLVYLY